MMTTGIDRSACNSRRERSEVSDGRSQTVQRHRLRPVSQHRVSSVDAAKFLVQLLAM